MQANNSVVELLRQVTLFHDTSDQALRELSCCITPLKFKSGERIITKGEEGNSFYVIASGSVKVHDGEMVVATLKQGNFFGEISLLDSSPRSMSITAIEDVELYVLSAENFYKVFKNQPEVTQIIVSTLTRRLRRQNEATIEQLRTREEELSKLVNERTAELSLRNTELSQAMEDLKVAKEVAIQEKHRAEEAKKFEEQFLANMSHEIRTPMNAVIGMTNLLLRTTAPTVQQLKYLKAIKTSSENLLTILNDILDLSKIEAGKIELEKIVFSLPEVLETVKQTLRFKAEEKGLNLNIEIEGEGFEFLIGDPVRLNQILINLSGNAIKFTEKGSVTIHCRRILAMDTALSPDKATLEFKVIDTGIGIPANKLGTIFESFSQASEETTRKYGGTGLGLTISKQLIEIKGGTIVVSSELGKGTTFTVTIPYTISAEKKVKEESVEQDDAMIEQLAVLNILLAEDNAFNQIVAVDTLQALIPGIKVEVANNGREAVDKLKQKDYDLVLMDCQMPEMSGYEAATYIRKQFNKPKRSIPIVAMTAGATPAEREKCVASGMEHYISKPFRPEDLLSKLTSIAIEIKKVDPSKKGTKPKLSIVEKNAVPSKITDMTFLKSFTGGNKEKMAKYINIFLQVCPQQLELMSNYVKAGNYAQLRGTAHALKPQITYMGIKSGEELIKKIEKHAEERSELERLPNLVDEFLAICNEALPELKQVVSE